MDFNDTPEEAAYRQKVRTWLEANAPRTRDANDDGEGGGDLAAAKAWQAKKAAAGFACITWPKEWGGQGGTPIQSVIFGEEEARYPIPSNPFQIGLGMCVPTVMNFADQATKDRFGPPAIRGEEIWCQLFSEPSGGSDVAAARTRAEKAPDGSGDWIINGQKVWTTGAQFSDFGIVIVRTDPNLPKHKGLTMFWVDMKDPGVEGRPIHQMSGGSGFNEVFFTDVRVKDSQRLGGVGDGWKVSLVTLMNERLAVGGATGAGWSPVPRGGPRHHRRRRRAPAPGERGAGEAGRLVRPGRRPAPRPEPDHDRPLQGPDPGPGKLHRQDRLGHPHAGPGQ